MMTSGTTTIHGLRHLRRHHDRKHIHNRKYIQNRKRYGRRSRRGTSCGRHVDVERVAAIMRAFYCWDAELAGLTNQLRAPTMTSSSSELARMRCRLLRRYDDCRRHFIDKVFRTGHGLAISWPRQITDVMDRHDYSPIYYK